MWGRGGGAVSRGVDWACSWGRAQDGARGDALEDACDGGLERGGGERGEDRRKGYLEA